MLSGREAELAGRLRDASAQGKTSIVLQLLEEGAPFVVDSDGQTALHQAASAGHGDTVAALVLGGCDVSVQDFTGHTALQRAASEGHVDIVKQLIKQGASVDHQDEVHGNTALHEAAWKGFSHTVQVLCKAKANFYIKNRGGFAPLHLCCQNGHNETCRVLLLNGCKPDIKNNYGDTPLHTSARYGHAGVIRILVSARCNASEQNKNGDTALHIAAAMGRRKLTKILLESGCDKDSKNKQSETSLDISRRKNLVDIMVILQNPPPILSQQDREDQADAARDRNQHPSKGDKKREKTSTSSKENDHERSSKREKKRTRHSKERKEDDPAWSPYGCHYEPDLDEFPLPRMNTLPDDPLRAGEQYFLDLAGNIKKGPTSKNSACYCGPAFQKFEKKLEKDKKELMKHIDSSHSKLDTKISHLERKTRDQLFNLNQTMKESFASERSECLDRMDRRALRERIAIERQQAVRDVSLKRDLASWLDKKLQEIEIKHGADAKNAALLRSLALRASKRGKKYILSDIEGGGTLRRAMSEELLSDVGACQEITDMASETEKDSENVYKGLKVSDKPSLGSARVRRNSAGDEIQVYHSQSETDTVTGVLEDGGQYHPYHGGGGGGGDGHQYHHHHQYPQDILSHSTNSESYHDTSHSERGSVASRESRAASQEGRLLPAEQRLDIVCSSSSESLAHNAVHHNVVPQLAVPGSRQGDLPKLQSNRMSSGRSGLIRPIPMCYNSENLPSHSSLAQGEPNKPPVGYPPPTDNQNYHFPSQMNPIRRFSTEADIHHATPTMLDHSPDTRDGHPPYHAPDTRDGHQTYHAPDTRDGSHLPPYRAPPIPANNPPPHHLYHPRDRLPRPGPLLPPVDEDEYVPIEHEEKDQDFHRQLLNLPLHSDVGSHDSHNDSGYSTRLGASAGPSPSLSGSRPGSTDGEGYLVGQGIAGAEMGLPTVGPRIRALQHQLKLADINDAKGSLV